MVQDQHNLVFSAGLAGLDDIPSLTNDLHLPNPAVESGVAVFLAGRLHRRLLVGVESRCGAASTDY
jgi:hypothetical protein